VAENIQLEQVADVYEGDWYQGGYKLQPKRDVVLKRIGKFLAQDQDGKVYVWFSTGAFWMDAETWRRRAQALGSDRIVKR
jgi:hypothetical protein